MLAVESKPDQKLGDLLRQRGAKLHLIGDCVNAGNALNAICEGASLALKI